MFINLKVDSPYSDIVSEKDKRNAAEMINTELSGLMKDNVSITTISVKDLVETGNRAIVYANLGLDTQHLGNVKAGNSHEIWPNKTLEKDVITAVKAEADKGCNQELVYASLNTTPDANTIVKRVFTDNLARHCCVERKEGKILSYSS